MHWRRRVNGGGGLLFEIPSPNWLGESTATRTTRLLTTMPTTGQCCLTQLFEQVANPMIKWTFQNGSGKARTCTSRKGGATTHARAPRFVMLGGSQFVLHFNWFVPCGMFVI